MQNRLRAFNLISRLGQIPPEAHGFTFGALPSPWDPRDYRYRNLVPTAQDLPARFSLRRNLPPPWNQGRLGTCVAASTCWGPQAFDEIQQGDFPAEGLSTAFLYTECKRRDGIPDVAGTYLRVAMEVLQKVGVCPEKTMPYSTLTRDTAPFPQPSPEAYAQAEKYRIRAYAAICTFDDATRDADRIIREIKTAIMREGPVAVAMIVHRSMLYPRPPDYKIPVPPDDSYLGAHAMCFDGWDDAYGAFDCRNTWGPDWGNGGYCRVPYEWVTARRSYGWCLFEAWTTVDMVVPKPANQVVIWPNRKTALVDGVEIGLDQPAVVTEQNRMLAPVRFLAGNLGYLVAWDEQRQAAVLTRPQAQ